MKKYSKQNKHSTHGDKLSSRLRKFLVKLSLAMLHTCIGIFTTSPAKQWHLHSTVAKAAYSTTVLQQPWLQLSAPYTCKGSCGRARHGLDREPLRLVLALAQPLHSRLQMPRGTCLMRSMYKALVPGPGPTLVAGCDCESQGPN